MPVHCTKKCVGGGGVGGVGLGDVCGCYSDESDLVLEIRNPQAHLPRSQLPSHGVCVPVPLPISRSQLPSHGVRGSETLGKPREPSTVRNWISCVASYSRVLRKGKVSEVIIHHRNFPSDSAGAR